jgi:hypothetical protein
MCAILTRRSSVYQEIPDILHINLRCLLVNLITEFSLCGMKVLLLSVSFKPVAYLHITVIKKCLSL